MVNKKGILILGIVGFILLVFSGFLLNQNFFSSSSRTLIYPYDSNATNYPGSGEILKTHDELYFVNPIGLGRPFFVKPSVISSYQDQKDKYELIYIPNQQFIHYAVGFFNGWEEISYSLDKYMLINYPGSNKIIKWRVSFEDSELFSDQHTSYLIEDISSEQFKDQKNKINSPPTNKFIFENSIEQINALIHIGDSIVLIPVYDPPEINKVDQNGNLLVSKIIIRR